MPMHASWLRAGRNCGHRLSNTRHTHWTHPARSTHTLPLEQQQQQQQQEQEELEEQQQQQQGEEHEEMWNSKRRWRRQSRHPNVMAYLCGALLLLGALGEAAAHIHKWNVMMNTFRYLQERMLRNSLERAHLNYGIVFECRTISDIEFGEEVHFNLQLGDLSGFRRLDANKKLALFLHGWNDQGSKDWVQELLQTWTLYDPGYNVCVVDWGHLSQMDYKSASMSIFDVGLTVAGIIMALEELRPSHFHRSNVTLAGYSLGAHAAGYAGAVLEGEVEQIIGLDPAGPLFTLPADVSSEYRLDKTDAQFVQVLHTSGGSLGTSLKCGHADFYPNGGKAPQPNCRAFMSLRDMQNTNPIGCSHSTAAVFFKQSMNPQYPFVGYQCDSYREFAAGKCSANRRARFGILSQQRAQGNFYFTTDSQHPYVQRQHRSWAREAVDLFEGRSRGRNRARNRGRIGSRSGLRSRGRSSGRGGGRSGGSWCMVNRRRLWRFNWRRWERRCRRF